MCAKFSACPSLANPAMTRSLELALLDAASARLCLKIGRTCQKLFQGVEQPSLVLALSGGADSTAMAVLFKILASRMNWRCQALHVNHHLRPDADAEQSAVSVFCEEIDMPLSCVDIDVRKLAATHNCGIEEAARLGRYDALEKLRVKSGAHFILLAHHARDLAEDMLMRLIRGCGWPALAGMAEIRGPYFRPLLYVAPEKLKAMLEHLHIAWCEDESNRDQAFFRNRVRHSCLPFFYQENHAIENNFIHLHQLAQADAQYWQTFLDKLVEQKPLVDMGTTESRALLLRKDLLKNQPQAVRLRLYCHVISQIISQTKNSGGHLRATTLFQLDKAYEEGHTGKIFQFPGGIEVKLQRNGVLFGYK